MLCIFAGSADAVAACVISTSSRVAVMQPNVDQPVGKVAEWEDFFFQAEDGIRDLTVTGVQTCALPISKTAYSRTCACRLEHQSCGAADPSARLRREPDGD